MSRASVEIRPPEPGLFVIWPDAEAETPRILSSINDEFDIRRVFRVRWSDERVDENFARFYRGQTVPPYSSLFSQQKGRGRFTVVAVMDSAPRYELRTTTNGPAVVNANLLDAKERFRQWTGGGMRVHGTDTSAEAIRDMLLLLGETPRTLFTGPSDSWDGTVELLERDVSGATGWSSLRDIFNVLDHAVPYVVLRNFEALPDAFEIGEHNDVDLLTDDYAELIRLLKARPMAAWVPRWGGRFLVPLRDDEVIFDLRFVGDGYYDASWAQRLLDRRRHMRGAFYAPAEDDYFESLAYHAVVHKRHAADDYRDRLSQMAEKLGRPGWHRAALDDSQHMAALVREIVEQRGFQYVRPRDPTVFFHYANAGMGYAWLRRKAAGVRRELTVRTSDVLTPMACANRRLRRLLVSHFPWLRTLRRAVGHIARRRSITPTSPGDSSVDRDQRSMT